MVNSNKDSPCLWDVVMVDLKFISCSLQNGILEWSSAILFVFNLDEVVLSAHNAHDLVSIHLLSISLVKPNLVLKVISDLFAQIIDFLLSDSLSIHYFEAV